MKIELVKGDITTVSMLAERSRVLADNELNRKSKIS